MIERICQITLVICFSFQSVFTSEAAYVANSGVLKFEDTVISIKSEMSGALVLFTRVTNLSKEIQVVTEVTSPQFRKVEFHRMSMDNGTHSMHKIKQLKIEPGKSVTSSMGRFHIMLIEPLVLLEKDVDVNLEFKLSSGKTVHLNTHIR